MNYQCSGVKCALALNSKDEIFSLGVQALHIGAKISKSSEKFKNFKAVTKRKVTIIRIWLKNIEQGPKLAKVGTRLGPNLDQIWAKIRPNFARNWNTIGLKLSHK